MTANVNDVLVVVVCFFAVTKPASNPSVITRSFEITRMSHMLVTYCSVDFTLLLEYLYFFGRKNLAVNSASRIFSTEKNRAANLAIGGGLGLIVTKLYKHRCPKPTPRRLSVEQSTDVIHRQNKNYF